MRKTNEIMKNRLFTLLIAAFTMCAIHAQAADSDNNATWNVSVEYSSPFKISNMDFKSHYVFKDGIITQPLSCKSAWSLSVMCNYKRYVYKQLFIDAGGFLYTSNYNITYNTESIPLDAVPTPDWTEGNLCGSYINKTYNKYASLPGIGLVPTVGVSIPVYDHLVWDLYTGPSFGVTFATIDKIKVVPFNHVDFSWFFGIRANIKKHFFVKAGANVEFTKRVKDNPKNDTPNKSVSTYTFGLGYTF